MNEQYNIIYSPKALNDLESIYTYIAFDLQAGQTAQNQVNRIRDHIRKLDTFPEAFILVDWEPWQSAGMHKFPVDNYVVCYMIDPEEMTVSIIRIFYAGRDIEGIVNSEDII